MTTKTGLSDKAQLATRFQFWIARLLGKKVISVEKPTKTGKGCKITGYWYNKVMYITNTSEIPCQA